MDKKYDGPERRKEMPDEERLAYDVKNLIQLAKDRYGKEQVTVRDVIDLATRKNDDVEALRRAVAVEIKTKSAYEQFIDGLNLADANKQKLREMMSDENYQRAVEAAKEMCPSSKIPTHAQIARELMTYSEERLGDICEMMVVPTLLIVPAQSFDERVDAMNEHKHYVSKSGKSQQENAYVNRYKDSPYKNAPKIKNGRVSIVEGIVYPAQLPGVSTKLGERRDHLTQKFAAKNMCNISGDEMAVLLQKSLAEAQRTGDNSKIVDNWKDGNGTATIIDPNSLAKSRLVAYAGFASNLRQADFRAFDPGVGGDYARGRASVQVLEF